MSIMLNITHSQKTYGRHSSSQIFNEETKYFGSMKEAKEHLKSEYGMGKHRTDYMYSDPDAKKTGWIISFRDKEYDRDTGKYFKFIHEVWASPYVVKSVNLSKLKKVL